MKIPIKIQSSQNISQPQMKKCIKIQSLQVTSQPQVTWFRKTKPKTPQIKKRLFLLLQTTKPNEIREAMALKRVWKIWIIQLHGLEKINKMDI